MRESKKILSKKDIVAKAILRDINSGRFAPGEKLPSIRELARMHKVSTVVIQQAAAKLEKAGAATRSMRRGLFVREISDRAAKVCWLLTSIVPYNMDWYFESFFAAASECGATPAPLLVDEKHSTAMHLSGQNIEPSRVFVDLATASDPEFTTGSLLANYHVTYFNRFEWYNKPRPESAVLIDYTGMTEAALNHFISRGHRKILFLSHSDPIMKFKQIELHEAARRTGLKFGSPEFLSCCFRDIENNPGRIAEIFAKDPPTAIFARSDYILYTFITSLRKKIKDLPEIEILGAFDSRWSSMPGHEFSTFTIHWKKLWDMAFAKETPSVEFILPELVYRKNRI